MKRMYKTGLVIVAIVWLGCLFSSCSKGANPEGSTPVPYVKVNVSININSSPYTGLQTIGGVAYATGGNRGIVLYRINATTITAFDRTCTYDLPDNGGIVQAENNGTAVCIDCGSTYGLSNGNVLSGPSTLGLQLYNTSFNSTTGNLVITN
jgi:Rieske Fe-S protein